MIKRPFFCLSKPRIEYELMGRQTLEPQEISLPKTVTLLLAGPLIQKDIAIKVGDAVKTGQKLTLKSGEGPYVISSATGVISAISPFMEIMDVFLRRFQSTQHPRKRSMIHFHSNARIQHWNSIRLLSFTPGGPRFDLFRNPEKPIHTVVVFGGNTDLLIATNQYVITSETRNIKNGIEILKKIAGLERIIIAVPRDLVSGFGHMGADLKGVDLAIRQPIPR